MHPQVTADELLRGKRAAYGLALTNKDQPATQTNGSENCQSTALVPLGVEEAASV